MRTLTIFKIHRNLPLDHDVLVVLTGQEDIEASANSTNSSNYKEMSSEENEFEELLEAAATEKSKKRRRIAWREHDELLLMDLWQKKLPRLRGSRKNAHILFEISEEMYKKGKMFSKEEIKVKMHNMTSKYRAEKNLIGSSGGSRSEWNHFEKMHQILESYKLYNIEATPEETTVEGERKKMKKRIKWKPETESILIDIWAEKFEELSSCRSNAHILEEIANILELEGHFFSVYEIKGKIHNLSNRYREERKKIAISGVRSEWPLFAKVHSVLGKHKSYDFENDSSLCKSEASTEFTFVESDSIMENRLLYEDDLSNNNQLENTCTQQKDIFEQNEDIPNKKRKYNEIGRRNEYFENRTNPKNIKSNEDDSSNCLNKLAKTVNDVVNFIMKAETAKSRNESFVKVLDSYLLQLPEKIQDNLKVEMLNTVFNKIKEEDEKLEDS